MGDEVRRGSWMRTWIYFAVCGGRGGEGRRGEGLRECECGAVFTFIFMLNFFVQSVLFLRG